MARQEDGARLLRLPEVSREAVEPVDVALAVPLRGGRVLVARRGASAHLGGAWEFPGGKLEEGESARDAAVRELAEETGLEARAVEPLAVFVYAYEDRTLRIHAFLVREPAGEVCIDGGRPWNWVEASGLEGMGMPEANRAILRALAWRLGPAAGPEPA